jgi:hypothetical protein
LTLDLTATPPISAEEGWQKGIMSSKGGMSSSRTMVVFERFLLLILLLSLGVFFAPSALAERDWQIEALEGDRVILFYPEIMPEENAKSLLENEERALRYVEDFLQVQYEGTVKVYITAECLFGRAYAGPGMITYCRPLLYFQKSIPIVEREEGEVFTHEIVHVVAFQLGQPSRALMEGLATAVNSLSAPSSSVDLHLLNKGLLQTGKLEPIVQVLTDVLETNLYVYNESGSFVLFLIQKYGIEKFKEFYQTIRRRLLLLNQQHVEQEFLRVYGLDLASVEREWHRFLEDYAPGLERRAEYIARAYFCYGTEEIRYLMNRLEEFYEQWLEGYPQYVGPLPERVYRQMTATTEAFISLAHNLSLPIEQAYGRFQESVDAVKGLLEHWWAAVLAFMDVKELIWYSAPYERIIAKLEEAQGLYQSVGDEVMVAKTSDYITAFQLLQEGEELLWVDNAQAKPLLLRALALFLQLDEQRMADKVRRLLDLCRYAII